MKPTKPFTHNEKFRVAANTVVIEPSSPSTLSTWSQQRSPQSTTNYNPLGESYSFLFDKLMSINSIQLPPIQPVDNSQPKPIWYHEAHYCKYHRFKAHNIEKCRSFKYRVQQLVNQGDIQIDSSTAQTNQPPINQATLFTSQLSNAYMIDIVSQDLILSPTLHVPIVDVIPTSYS